MDNRDLPSDSDSSDEDFVPDGVDSDALSEEESGPEDADLEGGTESGDEAAGKQRGRKREAKQRGGGRRKRQKKETAQVLETEVTEADKATVEEVKKLTEEEEKKKADSLWADFMKDVGGPSSHKPAVSSTAKTDDSSVVKTLKAKSTPPITEKENKVTITQLFEFAGEEVRVTKEVAADSAEARLSITKEEKVDSPTSQSGRGGGRGRGRAGLSGISSVLSQIGKKAKISTLEKSKLDWDRYKQTEGIEEEIQTHNRGKEGYLEKQDFLQRTDLRQFEIEKQMRASRRSNR